MAITTNQVHFLEDFDGIRSYPLNDDGDEVYAPFETVQNDTNELFIHVELEPVYAKKVNGDEYYPRNPKQGDILARRSNNELFYAKDRYGNEIYPKQRNGRDFTIENKYNKPVYAKNNAGKQFYPKGINGNQFLVSGQYIHTNDDRVIYPLNKRGKPIYEIDSTTGDEMYHVSQSGVASIGVSIQGHGIYAKRANGDQYYPPDGSYAELKEGLLRYAEAADKKVIFPKIHNVENYIRDPKTNCDVIETYDKPGNLKHIDRYALNRYNDEYYPRCVTNPDTGHERELIVKDEYAIKLNGDFYYPRDEFGNEYVKDIPSSGVSNLRKHFPVGYPITNDNWVIVPSKGLDEPFIKSGITPTVKDSNVIAKLYRGVTQTYKDFLTNVPSSRESTSPRLRYATLPLTATSQPPALPPSEEPTSPHHELPPLFDYQAPRIRVPQPPVRPPPTASPPAKRLKANVLPVVKPQQSKSWLTALILFAAGIIIVVLAVFLKKYLGY